MVLLTLCRIQAESRVISHSCRIGLVLRVDYTPSGNEDTLRGFGGVVPPSWWWWEVQVARSCFGKVCGDQMKFEKIVTDVSWRDQLVDWQKENFVTLYKAKWGFFPKRDTSFWKIQSYGSCFANFLPVSSFNFNTNHRSLKTSNSQKNVQLTSTPT